MARDEGWLAEHMLVLEATPPSGRPGTSPLPSLRLRQDQPRDARAEHPRVDGGMVGDDIAWMRFGADGRLYAINPEAGSSALHPDR